MYLQYGRPPYWSPFVKCLEVVVHHQRVHLCWCSVLTDLQHGQVHLLCCAGFLAVVLSLWGRDRNRMDSYPMSTMDVLYVVSSFTEVVLNSIPAFPESFNPSCHCEIWQRSFATWFKQFWKNSCVLRHLATSILIHERCSSFVNMVLGCSHYPYGSQRSTHCSRLTEYCRRWLHKLIYSYSRILRTLPCSTAINLTARDLN